MIKHNFNILERSHYRAASNFFRDYGDVSEIVNEKLYQMNLSYDYFIEELTEGIDTYYLLLFLNTHRIQTQIIRFFSEEVPPYPQNASHIYKMCSSKTTRATPITTDQKVNG